MRILYVIDSLAPGGAETSLVEMAPGLIRDGIDLHVLPLGSAQALAEPLRVAGAVVHQRGLPAGRLNNVRTVIREGRRVRPDLIHTTLFESDIAGRPAARLLGVPSSTSLVNEYYGSSHAGEVSAWKLKAVRALDAGTSRLASRFHAVSEAVARAVGPTLGIDAAKIDVISRGRDGERFAFRPEHLRRTTRDSLGLPQDAPAILAVGRLEPQKGIGDLLSALPAIADTHPDAVLLVAGRDGRSAEEWRRQASASPIDVRFLGHRTDMPALLAAADVLAFPSHREGSPGTLIEAMAVGIPIVASDIAPNLEVLGSPDANAMTVPVGDATALGSAVSATLSQPTQASARAESARARFDQWYTIESVAQRMADFFRRAADAGSPSRKG